MERPEGLSRVFHREALFFHDAGLAASSEAVAQQQESSLFGSQPVSNPGWRRVDEEERTQSDAEGENPLDHVDEPPPPVPPGVVQLADAVRQQRRKRARQRSARVENRHARVQLLWRVPRRQRVAAAGEHARFDEAQDDAERDPAGVVALQAGADEDDADQGQENGEPDFGADSFEDDVRWAVELACLLYNKVEGCFFLTSHQMRM